MNIVVIIPCKYNVPKFPGRPLANVNGKTLVHNIYVQAHKLIPDVYVATEDKRVASEVEKFGGKYVMIPSKAKSNIETCCEAVRNIEASEDKSFDVVICLQGNAPFIKTEQIEELKKCFKYKKTQVATMVKPINNREDLFNPRKTKVVISPENEAIYFSRQPIPYMQGHREESWISKHLYYKHIPVFGFRKDAMFEIEKLKPTKLETVESIESLRLIENGYKIKVAFTEHESVEIETPKDLEKVTQIGLL